MMLLPIVSLQPVTLEEANRLLVEWGHKMGPCRRGNARGLSHALFHETRPVVVTITAALIRERVGGGCHWLNRESCIELARLCAVRPGLCRVMLRMWREFVFPSLGYRWAMSYQDRDVHTGNTYRFDGWKKVAYAPSFPDTRTGRPGRRKFVWVWPTDCDAAPSASIRFRQNAEMSRRRLEDDAGLLVNVRVQSCQHADVARTSTQK